MSYLVVMIVIPMLLGVGVFGLEVTRAHSVLVKTQEEADRIAATAATLLPNTRLAQQYVERELKHFVKASLHSLTFSGTHAVNIGLSAKVDSPLVRPIMGDISWTVRAYSSAQVSPTDILLILSDSHTLRPGVRRDGITNREVPAASWNDYAPASYFSQSRPPSGDSMLSAETAVGSWKWWQDWSVGGAGLYPRWATEACFSKPFLAQKIAAISLVDYYLSVSTNRVGVYYAPGGIDSNGVEVLRTLSASSSAGGFTVSQTSAREAIWPAPTSQPTYGVTHESCVAFSDYTHVGDGVYMLPSIPSANKIGRNSSCPDPIERFNPGEVYESARDIASACYLADNLRLREGIYWHKAQLPHGGYAAQIDLREAIQRAHGEFQQLHSRINTEQAKQIRGNLSIVAKKKVVIFTDDLPPYEQIGEQIEELLRSKVAITFVAFAHEYLENQKREALFGRVPVYREKLSQSSSDQQAADVSEIFLVDEPIDLQRSVIPAIISSTQTITIAK